MAHGACVSDFRAGVKVVFIAAALPARAECYIVFTNIGIAKWIRTTNATPARAKRLQWKTALITRAILHRDRGAAFIGGLEGWLYSYTRVHIR